MNIHSRFKERLALLREYRNLERGYSMINFVLIAAIMLTLVVAGMILFTDNEEEQAVEEDTLVAHDAIWNLYDKKSDGIEDEKELEEILKDVTDTYSAARADDNVTVQSLLVNDDTITVIVDKVFWSGDTRAGGQISTKKTFVGSFTTGDDKPQVNVKSNSVKNDNNVLELD